MKSQKRIQSLIRLALTLAILVVINIVGAYIYGKIDLTEDKRFTLTKATNNLLHRLSKDTSSFSIEIYLEGEFPSEFRHLQSSVKDLLNIFRERSNGMVEFRFTNPLDGNDQEIKEMQQNLQKMGIMPLSISDQRQARVMLVFPSAVIRLGNNFRVISLVELGDGYYQSSDIDASINLLEYKFANAIKKLKQTSRQRIAILAGHGELLRPFTNEMEKALFEYYDLARIDLSRVTQIDTNINLLVIPKPTRPFGNEQQFLIDQYVMNGGKIIWFVDALNMEDDSLRRKEGFYVPFEHPIDFHNLLFNYGARINTNLISSYDAACMIGLETGMGQKSNPKWFYYPVLAPYHTPLESKETGKSSIDHPIVKNLDFVLSKYASSIDTIRTKTPVKKTPLLRSSRYSKIQYPPTRVSFDVIDPSITTDAFTKGNQTVAILLEGTFESFFRNRVPPRSREVWDSLRNYPILEQSVENKMIIVSDGDLIKNDVHFGSGQTIPMGAGWDERKGPRKYANKEFLMNCVEYLLDEDGLITARGREIKLRPLDQKRAFKEEAKWQFINLGLPLVVLGIFGLIYVYLRRRRYTR